MVSHAVGDPRDVAAIGMVSTLPRTLIVSEAPFSPGHGFGVTLSTFFDGCPPDRLRLFYTREAAASEEDLRDGVTFADVPGHRGRRYAVECLLGRRPAWRGRYSARWLRSALDGWWPEVVYAFVFSGETLAFAAWAARTLHAPLVVHVADDGLEAAKSGVTASIGRLLADASIRLTISEEMRATYNDRYGVESHVLHNGAADALFYPAASVANDVFSIRYLGSILPGQHFNAIEDVAEAVRTLNALGFSARFELYGSAWTRHDAQRLSDGRTTVYLGEISRADGFELLKTSDLLIVPVNFDPAAFRDVRLSLPTKLPEYLASGTPTVIYGPPGCAPVEFCRRHNVGRIVDGRSVGRMTELIRETATCRGAARQRASQDRAFIRQHFSATAIRHRFRTILASATAEAARL